MVLGIFDGIIEFFWKLIISIVAGIYQVVNYTYQIFLVLAQTNIFEQEDYASLTDKIYVILGVVMLFVVAYNFLMLIIDPDKNKGGASVEKMLKNIVIAFIMIVLCPSLFSFAFKVSDAVMDQGIFTKFFSDTKASGYDGEKTIKGGGHLMSGTTFAAFFNAVNGDDSSVKADGNTLEAAKEKAIADGSFSIYKDFAKNIVDDEIDFNWLVSLVAGIYLCYVIISFCFDMAVRVCKLAFYQIIAPLAIACRILPDKESIYKNWFKATSQTYISVFIRVFIMNLGIYLISIFSEMKFFEKVCDDCSFAVEVFGKAFIILGIVTFMRQASKLLDEIFGFGDVSLGIRDKLKIGGAFTAGAALGGGITSMTRNATHAWQNVKNAKGAGAKTSAAFKGIGSTIAGGAAGTTRGIKYGWSAGSAKDMASQARNATDKTTQRRDEREAYRASHDLGPIKGTMPIIGGIATGVGHIKDAGKSVARWAGVDNIEALERQNKNIAALVNAVDGVKDTARELMMSDALKNKKNDYGINATTTRFVETSDGGVAVNLEYNSSVYHKMEQAIEQAKTTGSSTTMFNGQTFQVSDLEDLKGLYTKKFSEQIANQAALSNDAWDAVSDDVKIQLDKVRTKAVDLRHVLEDSINSNVVEASNETARAAGKQEITIQTVTSGNLKFDGDNALGKLGDKAKLQTQENYAKIKKEREEEKK